MEKYEEYDDFAWIYNKYWGSSKGFEPVIEKFILSKLSSNASLLDLCCGTGQLAQSLTQKGYQVTGIDGSANMLEFAQKNAPTATFIEGDAREFQLNTQVDGVISTYDSLNHIMRLADLRDVFHNVNKALIEGGLFLFDMNLEYVYTGHWNGSFNIVENDHVCAIRTDSQPEDRLAQMQITMFMLRDNSWNRSDITLKQTWYREEEVINALKEADFRGINIYPSELFQFKKGRMFFLCKK